MDEARLSNEAKLQKMEAEWSDLEERCRLSSSECQKAVEEREKVEMGDE